MAYNRKAAKHEFDQYKYTPQQEFRQDFKSDKPLVSKERPGFIQASYESLVEFLGLFKDYFMKVYENPRLIITGILFLILAVIVLFVFHYLGMFLGYIIFDVILGRKE